VFADPQSVTINAVANSLPRISSSDLAGAFSKDDSNVILKLNHSVGRRMRHTVRLDHRKIAADPFVGSLNAQYSMSVYMVVDVPLVGYTVTEQKQVVDGLTLWTTTSSGGNITKLLGNES
jgi:hypothetical protein